MTRLDEKLARIRAGAYRASDFLIADAKDGDMGPSLAGCGRARAADGTPQGLRTRAQFLDQIRAIVAQDIVDIMLVSVANLERLSAEGVFAASRVKPAIRANDTTDIWRMRGATYHLSPSRAFRTASLSRVMHATAQPAPGAAITGTDLGLYSVTFNNDIAADVASLEAFAAFREDAARHGFRYFLEVFNPNVECGIDAETLPHYVNDCILRCLAGVAAADRPQFLKIAYNGPRALEELAGFDPGLIVGVLGGGAGTTRDTFELLHQAERHGARVALFGRKINLAEDPLAIVALMREVASGNIAPAAAVKEYHAGLAKAGIRPDRALDTDLEITEAPLREG